MWTWLEPSNYIFDGQGLSFSEISRVAKLRPAEMNIGNQISQSFGDRRAKWPFQIQCIVTSYLYHLYIIREMSFKKTPGR